METGSSMVSAWSWRRGEGGGAGSDRFMGTEAHFCKTKEF